MTRVNKYRLRTIVSYCSGLLVATMIGMSNIRSICTAFGGIYRVIIIGGCVLLIIAIWMNQHKRKIILTAEERERRVREGNFSNRFEWKRMVSVLFQIIYCFMMLNIYLYGCIKIAYIPTFFGVLLAFLCLSAVMPMFLHFKNQYIIEGDTLVVREYNVFRAEPELRIPLDAISEVYVKNAYTILPSLYITIKGPNFQINRQLHATTHTIELGMAICG